ncbi:MAG: hypothetical protein AAFX99_19880, partial [Myxococcota bacterium]
MTDPLGTVSRTTFDTITQSQTIQNIFRGRKRNNAFGLLEEETDANNNTTWTYYDPFLRLSRRTTPQIKFIPSDTMIPLEESDTVYRHLTYMWSYDANDRVIAETDASGVTTTYDYDALDRLTMVTAHDGSVIERHTYIDTPIDGLSSEDVPRVVFEDEAGNHKTSVFDGLGQHVRQEDSDGSTTDMYYNSRGQLSRAIHPWGAIEDHAYNHQGLPIERVSTEGTDTATTTWTYNARGQMTREVNPDGQIIRHGYDSMGRLLWKVLGDEAAQRILEEHTYDDAGRPIHSEEQGVVIRRQFDALGRIEVEHTGYQVEGGVEDALMTRSWTWTALDQVETETDGLGNTLTTTYNPLGHPTSIQLTDVTGADLGTHTTYYDESSQIRLIIDENGISEQRDYDTRGRVTSTQEGGMEATRYTYTVNPTTLRIGSGTTVGLHPGTYLTRITSPTDEKIDTYFDSEGRPYIVQDKSGVVVTESYEHGLKTHSTRYEVNSDMSLHLNAIKMVERYPNSARIHRDWNWMSSNDYTHCIADPACGRGYVEMAYTPGGVLSQLTDLDDNQTTYLYSSDGLAMLTRINRDGLPDVAYTYDNTYPILSQITLDPDGDEPLQRSLTWERNMRIQSVEHDASGESETINIQYDQLGRPTQKDFVDRNGTQVRIVQEFNARSQITERQYAITEGTTTTTYDPIRWGYNTNGTLKSITYPSGRKVNYTYQTGSRLLDTIELAHTSESKVKAKNILKFKDYNASGRAQTWIWRRSEPSQRLTMQRTFGAHGREESRALSDNTRTLRGETFTYDTVGQLESITAADGTETEVTTYGYNVRNMLTSETHAYDTATKTLAYTYDDLGRRKTLVQTTQPHTEGATLQQSTTQYTFDSGHRLTAVEHEGSTTSVDWDAYGQQTSDPRGNTLVYGLNGQLERIESETTTETMLYDANGIRVRRTVDGGPSEIYLGGIGPSELLHRIDASGATTDYVRLPSGQVVARLTNDGIESVVTNITGSPYRTDQSDQFANYAGFGELVSGEEIEGQLGFHNMMRTDHDSILVAGVRAYDSSTGRFTT